MVEEAMFNRFADQVAAAVKAEMATQFEKLRGELAGVRLEREHGDNTLAQRDSIHDERIDELRLEHGKVTYALGEMQRELNAGLSALRDTVITELRGSEARLEKQLDETAADLGRRVGGLEAAGLPDRVKKLERHSDDVVRGWTDADGRTIPQRMGAVEKERRDEKTRRRTLLVLAGVVSPILTALMTAWAIAKWGPAALGG